MLEQLLARSDTVAVAALWYLSLRFLGAAILRLAVAVSELTKVVGTLEGGKRAQRGGGK
jgi:hypothetical protein